MLKDSLKATELERILFQLSIEELKYISIFKKESFTPKNLLALWINEELNFISAVLLNLGEKGPNATHPWVPSTTTDLSGNWDRSYFLLTQHLAEFDPIPFPSS